MTAVLAVGLLLAAAAPASRPGRRPPPAEAPRKEPSARRPVNIDCNRMRVEGARQRTVCVGHVHVVRDTTSIHCDRLVAFYTQRDMNQVSRMVCDGNVEALDGNRWARGDHADYDNLEEMLVVTGNPEARQGDNQMTGDKVVFSMRSDVIDVEKVRAVLASQAPPPAGPATVAAQKPRTPVHLDCDHGHMEGAKQRMTCVGHVHAIRETTTLTCHRLVASYANKDLNQVTRMVCDGNVEAVDGDRWARGDHADFDNLKGVLVVTGAPEARQGNNRMTGDRVIFTIGTDLIEVEKVTGVLQSQGKAGPPGARRQGSRP